MCTERPPVIPDPPPSVTPTPTPAPTTPPLPAGDPLPLTALLGSGEAAALGLRRLAGPADAAVHAVHASDLTDPSPWLLGGELLLTAGSGLSEDPAGHEAYVARLVAAGAAALGFGVTPVHAEVPAGLLVACARHGLPLVEVPPRTPFTAVARAVWRLMEQARTRELRRVGEAQRTLAAATTRPEPVSAVLARLAGALQGYAALWPDPGGAHAGQAPPAEAERALARLATLVTTPPTAPTSPTPGSVTTAPTTSPAPAAPPTTVRPASVRPAAASPAPATPPASTRPAPASATDEVAGRHLAAYALGRGRAALVTAAPGRSAGDHTIAAVAAALLTLLTAPAPAAPRPVGPEAAALTRLLLDGDASAVLGPGPWTVVHARGDADPHALAAYWGTALYELPPTIPDRPAPDHPTDTRAAPTPTPTSPPPTLRLLTDRPPATTAPATGPAATGPAPAGWTLGVSAPVPPSALAVANAEAARALVAAGAAATGWGSLVAPELARAHARTLLAPLSEPLRETLRVWLARHGGWDRTAADLGVHRNTVRQRVARCASLLGRDLEDADTRMELWFALRHTAPAAAPTPPSTPRPAPPSTPPGDPRRTPGQPE
ncbi:PucR family transcriptional regulator ligand-binding domain-containing protein [Streptomyces sp. BI20]|uniref:PucR family transcriptional regulator ligand-binding domain-containing protein n=1 Tax=Streptomyces sp. BI20 TaxID=3403460 RepID=UPI003C74DA91